MKIPFTKSALEKFRARETEIDVMGDVLVGLQKLAEGVTTEIESARGVYYGNPTLENALKWENAKRRLSPNIALSMLEGERSTVQAAQNAERAKPEYVALLARALGEHNEAIKSVRDSRRAELSAAFKASGDNNADVDGMASLRGFIDRINRNQNTIVFMHDHPDHQARNTHIANALAFLNEPVDYVAPAPPAARPQQGFVPGGNLPVGHGILNPTNPEPDTRLQTVPANTINIDRIKAELDQVAAEREEQCRAEAARIAAANARTKQQQPVAVA